VPAIIFSDIGPVLSLTGAVGGSCISYIGPGLVFIGINGEQFLNKVGDWVERWRRAKGYSKCNDSGITESSDLPVEGYARLELPHDPNKVHGYERITSGPKPCWYYIGLFPIWCSVAERGATHMEQKIDAFNMPQESGNAAVGESKDVLPVPSNWDFFVAFFFVLFGILSLVAGVVSNVYAQWHNLDD
jgi:sodium-coupled neutral amino acid transporter 11